MQTLLGKSRALLIAELVPLMARVATLRGMVPHGSMTQAYAGMRKYLDENWEQLVAEALHKLYGPDRGAGRSLTGRCGTPDVLQSAGAR